MNSKGRSSEKKWQDAYLAQARDAAIGRLFRGTLHNLNGAVQAISMQCELLAMMRGRAQKSLNDLQVNDAGDGVRDALAKQDNLLGQMGEKVQLCCSILKKGGRGASVDQETHQGSSFNELVENEIDFLCSDSFFKHKVARKMDLCAELPDLGTCCREIGPLIFMLLENALLALSENGEDVAPELHVETSKDGDQVVLRVQDNGSGIAKGLEDQVFEPFFSTWEGHAGLGLYLARQIVTECGGTLVCKSSQGITCFILTLPAVR